VTSILATKLYMPPPRPQIVLRPRLIERLNAGLRHKLILLSAPAGFGKTTLLSNWLADGVYPAAWLSLDVGENDPARFLGYLVAAVQTLAPDVGAGVMAALYSPQPPSIEALLTTLINDLAGLSDPFLLVLDDYHVIEAQPVDQALTFVLEHLPPQLHLVLATREDPHLPLARLRAQGQLSELRAADLRFTPEEAGEFLTQVMGLQLTTEDVAALERRTEGWIAGLQLAGLSLQGQPDAARFIASFSGSHRFVLDYLVEEVLQRQPERIQRFLLQTSILERLCGSLGDAVLGEPAGSGSGQATLEYLEHANLFLIPLDHERQWYRYHHLFAELLRKRLQQWLATAEGGEAVGVAELHLRASLWFEEHDLLLEAFQHAAAAHDVDRAARLLEGNRRARIPLHFPGTVKTMLDWLASLPPQVLAARPALLVRYASLMLLNGQTTGVEEKLQVAEAALQGAESDDATPDVIGQIATARATLAVSRNEVETIIAQSRRALEYLHPGNLSFRTTAYWALGVAYNLQGERTAARQAFTEAITTSQASGNIFFTLVATSGLGTVQEADNQLYQAAETYRHVLKLADDQPLPIAHEAHLGLARIAYEWNDLESAEQHGQKALHLVRLYESMIDRLMICEMFLARLKLARGDLDGAVHLLAQIEQSARQQQFVFRLPDIAAAEVVTWLRQGQVEAAAQLAEAYDLPLSRARVYLAEGDPAALTALADWGAEVEARGWVDAQLKVRVLKALAYQANGEQALAEQTLLEALALGEPGGCIRTFVDEGAEMERLLCAAADRGRMPDYLRTLLAACEAERLKTQTPALPSPAAQYLLDPLSPRELEVLHLIANGLSNQEIAGRLVVAVETVKGHNKKIYAKLQVQRRTEAVARARELGLL
jgi:LuxR family transcriptional regulator, maltose regulon positive regulatory protein